MRNAEHRCGAPHFFAPEKLAGNRNVCIFAVVNNIDVMEATKPTKFILALRRYREYKKKWNEEMNIKLEAEEEALRQKRLYLYHDMETV